MSANERQVGGDHYKGHTIQHWDYAWEHGFDCFQYIITKWVERWRKKGGVEDLEKARHALDKYIELARAEQENEVLCLECHAAPGKPHNINCSRHPAFTPDNDSEERLAEARRELSKPISSPKEAGEEYAELDAQRRSGEGEPDRNYVDQG